MKKITKSKRTKIKRRKSNKNPKSQYKLLSSNTDGNNRFTVMTFNVELFLNLYDFSMSGNTITSAAIIPSKMADFNNLFENIDIACIQETYIPDTKDTANGLRIFDNTINHLQISHICKSHILDWNNATYLCGDPSYLANAVYVSDTLGSIPKKKRKKRPDADAHKINKNGLDRCFSISTIRISNKPCTVISVHLIGGRFDDIEAITNPAFSEEKINQVKQIVSMSPDIICGDFNTKIRTPMTETNTDVYFQTILSSMGNISKAKQKEYKRLWEKWIYMDDIHTYLTDQGYKSVYYSPDGSLNTSITDTSAFGGIVDMIYYKSTSIELVGTAEIVGKDTVMSSPTDSNMYYTPLLSDHYPVKATFALKS